MAMHTAYVESPLGLLQITADDVAVVEISFREAHKKPGAKRSESGSQSAALAQCIRELQAYFDGKIQEFSFPYRLAGTDFQLAAWRELEKIPYGETITYGQQAARLGDMKKSRAVGLCNGANPIAIVVPCHRVIGANDALVGYGGDLWRKQWLLEHEGKVVGKGVQLRLF